MDAISTELISKILDAVTQKKVTLISAFDIISISMELIDQLKVPGAFKSDIVTNVLRIIVEDKNGDFNEKISEHLRNDLKLLLNNNLIQYTINVIFDASKGKFNIGNIKSCGESLLSCIMSKK
jgi:hypothetical protein